MPRHIRGTFRPPGTNKVARPKKPPRGKDAVPILPGGARRFGVTDSPILLGGFGPPPTGWLTGNNSPEEYAIYRACQALMGPPGELWAYQGKIAAQLPGGIKPDFVIYQEPRNIVIRVQSDQYHQKVLSWKAAYDIEQRLALEKMGYLVIDVFPQFYMLDDFGPLTSKASIWTVKEAQQGRQRPDPRATRTSWSRA